MSRRHRSPWTAAEDRKLAFAWGVFNAATIARRLGRTVISVCWRAKKLGLGPAHRGTVTLAELERVTGHHRDRIKNAMRRMGITLQYAPSTTSPRRSFRRTAIDPEDADRVVEFLLTHPDGEMIVLHPATEWGVAGRPVACEGCGRTDRKHYARGWCEPCYKRSAYWLRKLHPGGGSS
jgi:hypothetical protein